MNPPIRELVSRRMASMNMTQVTLSEKSGVSQPNLSDFLSGKSDLRVATLEKVLKVLGLTVKEITPNQKG